MIKELEISELHDKKIIIYGAGTVGKYINYELKKQNIEVSFFCDRVKGGQICCGIPVILPREIGKYSEYSVIIAISGKHMLGIYDRLCSYGIKDIYMVNDLLKSLEFDNVLLSQEERQFKDRIEYFLWDNTSVSINSNEDIRIFHLDLLITEKCSLRCKNCISLIPYYNNPVNYDFKEVINGLKNLLEYVNEIYHISIMGGEPFMDKDIYKYICELTKMDKIKVVTVFTNATILPNKDKLKDVLSNKIRFCVSDYGKKSTYVNEWRKVLVDLGIDSTIIKHDFWYDVELPIEREYTEEETRKLYFECICKSLSLLKGKLYSCQYSVNGRNMGLIPENEDDILDFTCLQQNNKEEVQKKLLDFLVRKNTDLACRYCNGRDADTPIVKPALQIK